MPPAFNSSHTLNSQPDDEGGPAAVWTADRSGGISQDGPRCILPLTAGFLVVGLVVVEVAPGAPAPEVGVVHVPGVIVGVGDGEFDADFAGEALGVEGGAGAAVVVAPDPKAFLDPHHLVPPGAGKLGVAGLPGVGEDPGVQRLFAAFALLAGPRQDARPGDGQPLAAVQVPKFRADGHQSSPFQ